MRAWRIVLVRLSAERLGMAEPLPGIEDASGGVTLA